jgi:hypothetical protein
MMGVLAASTSCGGGGEEGTCTGPEILPHRSPVPLIEMYPTTGNEENIEPNSPESTPYEYVLLLQATCGVPVEIQKTCLIGEEDDDGNSDADQFELEGPVPDEARPGEEAAMRITYTREQPNSGDDVDNAALVVQSNAENFPTLVVPVCGRVVADGEERGPTECASPVTVDPGERDDSLCD